MFQEIRNTLRSHKPEPKKLRLFAVVLAILLLAVSYSAGTRNLVIVGIAASAILFFLAAVFPAGIKPIWLALMALTLPIGWLVSRTLLIGFFYLVLTPASLLLTLFRKDILKLKRKKENTYWEEFEENKSPDSMGL